MTKKLLIKRVARETGQPEVLVEGVLNSFLFNIGFELCGGDAKKRYVVLSRFGTFTLLTNKERSRWSPSLGRMLNCPATFRIKFTAAKSLTKAVNAWTPEAK